MNRKRKKLLLRASFCIIILFGLFTMIYKFLFWGTITAHFLNWLRFLEPYKYIIESVIYFCSLFSTFAVVWTFFSVPPAQSVWGKFFWKFAKRPFLFITMLCVFYVPFHALDQAGLVQWLIHQQEDSLEKIEDFLENTQPNADGASDGSSGSEVAAPILPQLAEELSYQTISAEQRSHIFYIDDILWHDLHAALQQRSFYTVEEQVLHGVFPTLFFATEDAVHNRLMQQTKLHTPALNARVDAPDGNGKECSLLEAMDACDHWAIESSDSSSLEECLKMQRYLYYLYTAHPCERSARLYADSCYRVQEYLSSRSVQLINGDILLYYIAEEIAAYEALYRHTRNWQVFNELTGAYSRIAASELVESGERLQALVLSQTEVPPDCI